MRTITFKLVLRSWWRNKTFAVISIVSLAVGIACTNLLAAFVIHEFNIEGDNPKKPDIYLISQDSPMKSGEKTIYVSGQTAAMLKEKYPEIDDFVRLSQKAVSYVRIGDRYHDPIKLIGADPSFMRFFPYETRSGNLMQALTEPDQIALTEKTAKNFFGTEDPIGKTISISLEDPTLAVNESSSFEKTFRVAAVLKERSQAFVDFNALISLDTSEPYFGSPALFLMNPSTDPEAFALRMKEDKIQTLQGDLGRYYFNTIADSYFGKDSSHRLALFNHRQPTLLYVGLVSALLILLIACGNYINLNFSRLLQQVRMIHTQRLMGAGRKEINRQLFTDTFLTVVTAFLFSLLIMHDLLPVFNSIVSGKLPAGFFLNGQVLAVISLFILLLSVIPAFYISRKIGQLSGSGYRSFFTGKKKKNIISVLTVAQFAVSIVLIIATLTVNDQIRFIREGGSHYKNLIEIGNWKDEKTDLRPFVRELRKRPETTQVAMAGSSLLNNWIMQLIVKDKQGNETYYSLINYYGEADFLDALQLKIVKGLSPEKALQSMARPVYINEKYAKTMIPSGEDPIGKPLSAYDHSSDEGNTNEQTTVNTIAGIVEDLYTESMEKEVCPVTIQINNGNNTFDYAYIRLGDDPQRSLTTIRQVWKQLYPGQYFIYRDVYREFLSRNAKAGELSALLLMYSLISLFLTCFGLFGIALYATEQRTKEIGIRKVNGATTGQIMLLLNRQFVRWIGIAFLLAVPASWLLLNRWLESFVYRTDIHIVSFLLAILIVTVITLLTVSWHSFKAASGNPVNILRNE